MMFMPGVGIRLKMVQTEVVRALRPTSGRWARTLGRAATRATNGRHLVLKRLARHALGGGKKTVTIEARLVARGMISHAVFDFS
jgi:hypothetical protein